MCLMQVIWSYFQLYITIWLKCQQRACAWNRVLKVTIYTGNWSGVWPGIKLQSGYMHWIWLCHMCTQNLYPNSVCPSNWEWETVPVSYYCIADNMRVSRLTLSSCAWQLSLASISCLTYNDELTSQIVEGGWALRTRDLFECEASPHSNCRGQTNGYTICLCRHHPPLLRTAFHLVDSLSWHQSMLKTVSLIQLHMAKSPAYTTKTTFTGSPDG